MAPPPAARAGDGFDLTLPPSGIPDAPMPPAETRVDAGGIAAYLAGWNARLEQARDTQPSWSSPVVTTTGLLEQRVRFDIAQQQAGNGTHTTVLDLGKGLDLVVADNTEIQIGAVPYSLRTAGTNSLTGFNDWPFLRLERRLASAPAGAGNYVLTAWLTVQAPAGSAQLSSGAWVWQPTLAFGKGWGDFDIQGTVGGILPASRADSIGYQVQTNLALQYEVMRVIWPELEVNWTWFANGQRGGLNQVYLTPGVVLGRFALTDALKLSVGVGYQSAVSPAYRATPLTPAYDHAWIFSTRMNF